VTDLLWLSDEQLNRGARGRPPVLVAGSGKMQRELGWRPARADLGLSSRMPGGGNCKRGETWSIFRKSGNRFSVRKCDKTKT